MPLNRGRRIYPSLRTASRRDAGPSSGRAESDALHLVADFEEQRPDVFQIGLPACYCSAEVPAVPAARQESGSDAFHASEGDLRAHLLYRGVHEPEAPFRLLRHGRFGQDLPVLQEPVYLSYQEGVPDASSGDHHPLRSGDLHGIDRVIHGVDVSGYDQRNRELVSQSADQFMARDSGVLLCNRSRMDRDGIDVCGHEGVYDRSPIHPALIRPQADLRGHGDIGCVFDGLHDPSAQVRVVHQRRSGSCPDDLLHRAPHVHVDE